MDGLLDAAQNVVTQFAQALVAKLPALVETAFGLLGALVMGIYEALPALWESAQMIIQTLASQLVAHGPEILSTGSQILGNLVTGILSVIPSLITTAYRVVETLGLWLINNAPSILEKGKVLLQNLIAGIQAALPGILDTASTVIVNLIQGLITNFPKIVSSGMDLVASLVTGLLRMLPKIANAAGKMARKLWDAILETDWIQLGKDIIQGMIDGIGRMAGLLWEAAKSIANSFLEGVKGFFGINSPSTVMRDEVGKMLPRGAAIGVEADTPEAVKSVDRMAEEMLYAASRASLAAQTQAGQSAAAVLPVREENPDPETRGNEPRPFVQNINFYAPVPAPDETARAIRISETYGLAGDKGE